MYKIKTFFVVVIFSTLFIANDTFAQDNPEQGRPNVPGVFMIDVGFNMFQDHPDTLETGFWGSKVVNLSYLFEFKLTENIYFLPGFGLGLNKYRFENQVTLATTFDNPDQTLVVGLEEYIGEEPNYEKSKLAVNYVEVPLEFRFYSNPDDKTSSFKIGIGGKIGVMYSSHTKINYNFNDHLNKLKSKEDFNINRLRYGVLGRVGYGVFGLFGYYSLNSLFEEDAGFGTDEMNTISFGISVVGF